MPRSAIATWPGSGGGGSTTTLDELRDDILYQIGALEAFCRVAGGRVGYLKPHGALYNTAAVDEGQAVGGGGGGRRVLARAAGAVPARDRCWPGAAQRSRA